MYRIGLEWNFDYTATKYGDKKSLIDWNIGELIWIEDYYGMKFSCGGIQEMTMIEVIAPFDIFRFLS